MVSVLRHLSQALIIPMIVLVHHTPCVTANVVATTRTHSFFMKILMHVRRKRETQWDFTELNLGLCPPSLCRAHDEKTGETIPRPRGTGGTVFYQGDIILDSRMTPYIYPSERGRRKRATMRPRRRLWKKGVFVYRFAKAISPEAKKAFERGMKHIQKRTCITFREKTDKDRDFVRFISEPGCWSQVGHVGGIQLVSLGRGCESPGTAVHEMLHALGVWHEQARPDRNKYIRLLDNNISKKFMADFEKVSKRISSSRGYPYDYRSLMHYSRFAFTRNGRPTMEVIGIGKKLGLRIGQRRGLSTIDLSQLREMYKCNLKSDEKESVCPKGFKGISTTCYKFFPNELSQFGPAFSACEDLHANLLILDSKRKERLFTRYVTKKFGNVTTWRLGARRVNNRMMWKMPSGKYKNITYSNWAKDNPSTYTSAILKKHRNNQFKWFGEWSGSASQKPNYQHAFACQRAAKRKCVNGTNADGRDYRGELDHTRDGWTCQRWTENYPHSHPLFNVSRDAAQTDKRTDDDGLGDHNHCRNPSGLRRNRPWCYVTKKKIEWNYCDVSTCLRSIRAANAKYRVPRKRVTAIRTQTRSGKSNYGSYGSSGSSARLVSTNTNRQGSSGRNRQTPRQHRRHENRKTLGSSGRNRQTLRQHRRHENRKTPRENRRKNRGNQRRSRQRPKRSLIQWIPKSSNLLHWIS